MKTISFFILTLKKCIMSLIALYSKYFLKMGVSLKTMSHSTAGVTTSAGLMTLIVLSPVQKALAALFFFLVVDFITGIIASYFRKREAEKLDPSLKDKDLISSEKLKLSLVKLSTYIISILGCWIMESVFFLKTISISSISDKELTITLICIGFCCVIELWSIIFENFKDMGFDVVKRFNAVVRGVKKMISETKK